MTYDIDNKRLRLILRAILCYEKHGGTDAMLDKREIKQEKDTIILLLQPKRLRSNMKTRA